MKRFFAGLMLVFFVFSGSTLFAKETNWKDEFDSICSKVQISESLSTEELNQLIKRSEELIKRLEKLDLPVKKVYIFRLKKCKSFFEYVIQLRQRDDKQVTPRTR